MLVRGLVCLAVLAGGCAGVSRGEVVPAPAGCRWRSAWVEVERTSRSLRASDMGPRWTSGGIAARLMLAGPDAPYRVRLDDAGATDAAMFDRVKSFRRARLSFAADGHALALSTDEGKAWRYVALDAGERPFYCRHVSFQGADPWASAPTTRALALEILASSNEPGVETGRNHATPGETFPHDFRDVVHEFRGAVLFAGAHDDDPALRLALARALLLPGNQLGSDDLPERAIERVAAAATKDEKVREVLLRAPAGPHFARLVRVLALLPDAAAQDRLAELTATEQAAAPTAAGDGRWLDALQALAASTLRRRAGCEAVARALTVAATGARPMPPGLKYDYEKESVLAARAAARRIAAYGLLGLGTPAAKATVAEIARPPCQRAMYRDGQEVVEPGEAPLPWSKGQLESVYDEIQRDRSQHFTTSCWVRNALAAAAPPAVAPPPQILPPQ